MPNPFRHDSLWEAVWTGPSESASPAAALVAAQGSGNVASYVGEGVEAALRAQDARCRDDSSLDALADALAGPLAVLGEAGQILRPLFQLAGASPSDGAAKAAAILLAELATAEGRPGVADACLRVMTAQPATELVQALANLERPALRQRLLRRLAGREGAAAALVAAAIPHTPWLLNELVACGDAAEAVSSAFRQALADLESAATADEDDASGSGEPSTTGAPLSVAKALGAALAAPGQTPSTRHAYHLSDALALAAERIEALPGARLAPWLDLALACCPPPGAPALEAALQGALRHRQQSSSATAFAKGDLVWYWAVQAHWLPAEVGRFRGVGDTCRMCLRAWWCFRLSGATCHL